MAVKVLSSLVLSYLVWATTVHGTPIHGGEPAADNEFPYLAFVTIPQGKKCGGAIIHESIVLTACHCVYDANPKHIYVITGKTELVLDIHSLQNLYVARRYVCHPGYKNDDDHKHDLHHDIALVRTSLKIVMGPRVQIYPLPSSIEPIEEKVGIVAGWGIHRRDSEELSKRLLKVEIEVSDSLCYEYRMEENYICTLDFEAGRGTDKGDSGGPLVIDGTIYGIVAKGYFDDRQNIQIALYARVTYYLQWIDDFINILMCSEDQPDINDQHRHSI